ncbi:hypothetical protein JM79_3199 [Gramella sp. Hel_I_59]|nr:hypothetical protein JM79_3199 [Gramella sp. Hel_I_59]
MLGLPSLGEEELRTVQKYCDQKIGKPEPKKKRRSILDDVADQLGEEFRPGNEGLMLANILTGN